MFPVEWYQLYCRDYCLVDDAGRTQTGESRETKGVGRYAGWFPVCGWKYTDPYVVAFNECDQFFRVALDDVYPGLRENDPARGERDARVTTFMYRCRFLHCGLVSGCPEKCTGFGKSGDAFRGFAGNRVISDVVCHDPLGGSRVMSAGGFHDYRCRGFHQHAVADPFRRG